MLESGTGTWLKKRLVGVAEVALNVVVRHKTLVAPEKNSLLPRQVSPFKPFVHRQRGGAAGENDGEAALSLDALLGEVGEQVGGGVGNGRDG